MPRMGRRAQAQQTADSETGDRSVVTDEQLCRVTNDLAKNVPLARLGEPDEIAKAVSFLASDEASYVAGIELYVDGGIAQI
jgi:NAD(P)-dependent dehydrogenase (short-subunit alcohol dehydrogenase family)